MHPVVKHGAFFLHYCYVEHRRNIPSFYMLASLTILRLRLLGLSVVIAVGRGWL